VFSAGSLTSERERQTLDLLLTTTISPWQILWGKLRSGLRVSGWLTRFLLWPLLLACVMVSQFWSNLPSVLAYLVIVELVGVTTALTAMFTSVMFRKTATSLMTTYLVIVGLFAAPVAVQFFAETFLGGGPAVAWSQWLSLASPFAAIFNVPLTIESDPPSGDWKLYFGHLGFGLLYNTALAGCMIWLFNTRWRVSE